MACTGRRVGGVRPKQLIATVLALSALVAAGCAASGEEVGAGQSAETADGEPSGEADGAPSGTLRLQIEGEPGEFDPAIADGRRNHVPMALVFEGLVARVPDGSPGEFVNVLAESFEFSEDGLTADFTLKEGIQFHGGYGEVTAKDVKFSFERLAGLTEPPIDVVFSGHWENLEEVVVTGEYSGQLVFSRPTPILLTLTLPSPSGYIVSQAAVEELGEEFIRRPIGTGPYEVADVDTDRGVTLVAFEDYSGAGVDVTGSPEWERIELIRIDDGAAQIVALEAGEIDYVGISELDAARLESAGFGIVREVQPHWGRLHLNVQHPQLADVAVRRAIRAAIDPEQINQGAVDGSYSLLSGGIPPSIGIGFWPDAPSFGGDPDGARAILEEAGIDPSSLDLVMHVWGDTRTAVGQIVQAQLADVGIDLELEVMESGSYEDAMLADGAEQNRQIVFEDWSIVGDPSDWSEWIQCGETEYNYSYWCDEEFTALHQTALTEMDPQVRSDLYIQMQEITIEQVPVIYLFAPTRISAYDPDVVRLLPGGSGNEADFARYLRKP
jgi:peptide/nickel transport system substrate-binding protein